jgi:hypothetical protein
MTAEDMLYECEVGFEAIANFSLPGFEKKEWSSFLTQAQENILKQRLNVRGNKYGEILEGTEKRSLDFSELVKSSVPIFPSSLNYITQFPNSYLFTLPTDCFYPINERVETDKLDCKKGGYLQLPVKPISHGYYNANSDNPLKKPYLDRTEGLVWRVKHERENETFTGGTTGYIYDKPQVHEIITDGTFGITSYLLRYLRRPRPILIHDVNDSTSFRGYLMTTTSLHCELDESIHPEIVTEAIKKAAASMNDQARYQISNVETLKNE